MKRLRQKLSALVLWCAFLALYLGGAVMLVIGLVFASREWWRLTHQQASLWLISTTTAEVLVLALGLALIMFVPFLQRRSARRNGAWRAERRSETKGRVPKAD